MALPAFRRVLHRHHLDPIDCSYLPWSLQTQEHGCVANRRGGWGDRAGGKAVGREHVYRTNQRQTGQQATGKVIIKREEVPGGRAEIHWECTGAPTVVPLCTCVIDYSEVR